VRGGYLSLRNRGGRWETWGRVVQRPGVVNAKYVLDMVLPCLPAG